MLLSAILELTPDHIRAGGGPQQVSLRYLVGSDIVTRACDRIVVGGVAQPGSQCFDVTGTTTSLQPVTGSVVVDPAAFPDTDFVRVEVFVREVDPNNTPIGAEQQCFKNLRIDRT